MAQDIVADDMLKPLAERPEFRQIGLNCALHNQTRCCRIARHRGKSEDTRLFLINLKIDRNTTPQHARRSYVCDRIYAWFPTASLQPSEGLIFFRITMAYRHTRRPEATLLFITPENSRS